MPSKNKARKKRIELIEKAMDNCTDQSTQFSKADDNERMNIIQEKVHSMSMQGHSEEAKDLKKHIEWSQRIEAEAMAETKRLIQESSKKMTGYLDKPRTDDGDQSPVYGDDLQRLKVMWANGMGWHPSNPGISKWLITCVSGNYDGMIRMLEQMPKHDLKNFIERRETLLNVPAVFHVVKGASMLDSTGRNFDRMYGFVNPTSSEPRHIDCLRKLIELGCNVNIRDFAGFTPLHICVTRYGNEITFKMAKILLKSGADVNARNRLGETAVIQPLMSKDLDFIKLLLDHGLDPTIKNNNGISAIDMNVYDKDLNVLFAEAYKKKSKEMVAAAKGPGGILKCELCGELSSKRCTGCYVTRYCSRECQITHWRQHRKECKENKNRYVPVKLINDSDSDINISKIKGGKVTSGKEKPKAPKVNFIVKIQVPMLNETMEPLNIYDETRNVAGRLPFTDPSYKPLSEKVKAEGVYGKKGYFYAIVDKDDQLRININDIQPPRLW